MNLAYKYPIIFWDTANLIVDSGSMNLQEEFENFDDTDEKIKNSSCDYGKMASAIGKMRARGLSFSLPDINKSDITFSPDIENNTVIYGLRGTTRVGNQLIKDIIENRPYTSIEDFLNKVKANKVQMINIIKAGMFDNIYQNSREEIMNIYLDLIADKKKRVTLQNMQMLIAKDMIPQELTFEKRVFNFNKYLKKFKEGIYYNLDNVALKFYLKFFDENNVIDLKIGEESSGKIKQTTWDGIYKKTMSPVRDWMKTNQQEILNNLNNSLMQDVAEKYTEGSISKWEMDSLSFYYHEHELSKLKSEVYGISDYIKLPDEPEIEKAFRTKDGTEINIYKISRIAGTVIDKDKNKGIVSLLTTSGVVTVKVWKSQFAKWDKQISEKGEDGVKHIIEKSWFTKGNKMIITGIKKDNSFIPKKYKNTEWPLFEKIEKLDDRGFIIESYTERADEEEE